jgi:hypothetical protein
MWVDLMTEEQREQLGRARTRSSPQGRAGSVQHRFCAARFLLNGIIPAIQFGLQPDVFDQNRTHGLTNVAAGAAQDGINRAFQQVFHIQ